MFLYLHFFFYPKQKRMKLQTCLLQHKILWDYLYAPNIEALYEHQTTPWAQGGFSDIFLLQDNRLCKREKLYAVPSPHNNDTFYNHEKGHPMFYIKESFLLEALVMETLHPLSPLLPRVYDYKFGQVKNGTWVSILIMEKMDGKEYPPKPFQMEEMKSLWIPLFRHLNQLYKDFSFIHGDLIFRNMKIREGQLVLFDFGLSSLKIGSTFFCRYHSFQRCIAQLLSDSRMLTQMETTLPANWDCHDILLFVQQHRQGVDICAMLGRFMKNLPSSIVKLLGQCIGGRSSTFQQTTMTRQPFPMSYSREVITYPEIIRLLS
jgi:hypothetical protein